MNNKNDVKVFDKSLETKKRDYYDKRGNTIKDFLFGFLGSLFVLIFIHLSNINATPPGYYVMNLYAVAVFVFIIVALLSLFFRRMYISLGIACLVLLIVYIFFSNLDLSNFT